MARLFAHKKQGHCSAARMLAAAALVAASPLIDAYAGSTAPAGNENDNPIVIYLPPQIKPGESVETVIKRMNSEKIVIVFPPEYVAQNRAAVDSMVKSNSEANMAIRRLVSSKPVRRIHEEGHSTAVCSSPQSAEGQIRTWYARRHEAFELMSSVFPKSLENDYGARKNDISVEPPSDIRLGIYHDYLEKSIGIACVFFYKEGWKEKADEVVENIDWAKVRSNIDVMIAMKNGKGAGLKTIHPAKGIEMTISVDKNVLRQSLSDEYLSMIAVLADVMEQLTGVDRNTQLALGTQETRLDHNNFNPIGRDRGLMQLNRNNPLFTYVAFDNPRSGATKELENVMYAVLPEKSDFERAREMMAGLFNAIDVGADDRQGDIAMNMIAGALTYRYKYYMNTGKGRLTYQASAPPSVVSYDRKSVEDYNGARYKKQYAMNVERYWSQFRRAIRASV